MIAPTPEILGLLNQIETWRVSLEAALDCDDTGSDGWSPQDQLEQLAQYLVEDAQQLNMLVRGQAAPLS